MSSTLSDAPMDLTINTIVNLQIVSFKIHITNHKQSQYTIICDLTFLLHLKVYKTIYCSIISDSNFEHIAMISKLFIAIISFNFFLVHAGVVPSNFDAHNVLKSINGKCK